MLKDQQNYYWLFSSSAQAISAFVAFLITGYAIVLNVMDGLEGKDDTLEEIHHKLKLNYYRRVIWLIVLTGAAIVFSLWMVYLNGGDCPWKPYLYSFTILLNIAVVILGISFVIAIINPNRYKTAAKEIIKEDEKTEPIPDSRVLQADQVDQLTFMKEFIRLEMRVRKILENRGYFADARNINRMPSSFQQMVQALYQNELISTEELQTLLRVNRFRNLVFHGRQEKVDSRLFDLVKDAEKVIDKVEKADAVNLQ